MLLLLLQSGLHAQNRFNNPLLFNNSLSPDSICPDVCLHTINNQQLRLSNIKKPLILLDLFNTNCGAIPNHFREINTLQTQLQNAVKIIAVTKQDKSIIEDYLQHTVTGINLTVVAGDTVLFNLFPYRMVPQVVWLDSSLHVLAITVDYDVTAANIQAVLQHKPVRLDRKQDMMDFDVHHFSFLATGSTIKTASVITGYNAALPAAENEAETGEYKRLLVTNETVTGLCRLALHFYLPANRIILQTKHAELFSETPPVTNRGLWLYTHLLCYENILPAGSKLSCGQQLLDDLNRHLHITATVKKVKTRCYVVKIGNTIRLATRGGVPMTNFDSDNTTAKWMRNLPASSLLSYLNTLPGMPPCLDETNFTARVDMQLNTDLGNVPALQKALSRYGLYLHSQERYIKMLVIKDVPE
jgi:hypothetical protein